MSDQRLARRASILAAARDMIAEHGYEKVTVRDLANLCQVSVPTLYNQFGGKDQLLAAAIEEHFLRALSEGGDSRAKDGFPRLLRLIDRCAAQLVGAPSYQQRLLEAFTSLGATLQIQERIAQALTNLIASELITLASQRQLAGWAVPEHLAKQMTTACIGTAVQWSAGVIADDSLQASMRYAMGLVILGVLRGRSRKQLEAHLESAQSHITASAHSQRSLPQIETGAR